MHENMSVCGNKIKKNDVVQINEYHKWTGCLGIVDDVKDDRILVGVPIPEQGVAYIFCDKSEVDYIGKAVLVVQEHQ